MPWLERARRLLPGLWLGFLLCIGAVSAPAAFAVLARPDAGHVVARLFVQEAYLSLVLGVLLLLLERGQARRSASTGQGSQFSAGMVLALGAVFCTVAGYFALQPMMAGARSGQGPLTFGQLHGISVAFLLVKMLCVAGLAWRAPGAVVRPTGPAS